MHGSPAIRTAAVALSDGNPVGHHSTNVVVTERGDGTVGVRSKDIGVNADGTVGSVTYEDTVVATDAGRRIDHRRAVPRRVPANGRRS